MRMFDNSATIIKPRLFGRGKSYVVAAPAVPAGLGEDIRLFAVTFAAGFLFMTVFLA